MTCCALQGSPDPLGDKALVETAHAGRAAMAYCPNPIDAVKERSKAPMNSAL
jgi:hypothetical protein